MKFIYPAVLRPTSEGYEATFPDLAGCQARGETLDEAIENAHEAAMEWITIELSEDSPAMPGVSEPDEIDLPEGAVLRNIAITYRFYDGYDE